MHTTRKTTYPNPDDTNPATRDRVNLGEAPVGEASNDRRDELRNAEGTHERVRGTLHEEEAVRTGDEDKSLRDNGNLEVDDHVELRVVVVDAAGGRVELDTELVLEERRLDDRDNKDNPDSARQSPGGAQHKQPLTSKW